MAILAGAKSMSAALPKNGTEKLPLTLVIGTQENVDSPALESWKTIARDIISLSVLRGRLDAEGEEIIFGKTSRAKETTRSGSSECVPTNSAAMDNRFAKIIINA
ncbi:hypothetical protein N7G274_000448 [Stereocaulon virgatum]|uniref:Uncharacterized protein n=1 Tax=Stereocaulon virgatum TaxID=373712 RepID=A0ABR4ASK0_9LECA